MYQLTNGTMYANGPDETRSYVISNYEAVWSENPDRITVYDGPVREDAYFIMPPEEWAKNSKEALHLLKKYYSDR